MNKLIKNIKLFCERMSLNPQNFSLVMSENEAEFFKREIQTVKTYLEFGAGGSTILAVLCPNLTKIVSV